MKKLWTLLLRLIRDHKLVSFSLGIVLVVFIGSISFQKKIKFQSSDESKEQETQSRDVKKTPKHKVTPNTMRRLLETVGRDNPFQRLYEDPEKLVEEPGSLNLKGIAWDESHPMAIINNLIVREGDVIEGQTILKIEPGHVIFIKNNQKETLLLK